MTDPRVSDLLTVAEVSERMRVSKMTVYRLVHDGELPAMRIGNSFRITREEVEAFLRRALQIPTQIDRRMHG